MFIKPALEVKFIEQQLEDNFISLPEKHPIKKEFKEQLIN